MRIGAVLSPVADWERVRLAAQAADEAGLDAIGLWSHYHSDKPEWSYVAGWSVYGALAAATERVRLVPMVLNNLHYQVGVIAKESAMLSLISGGRFELAIGAGDWPDSYAAWGEPYPRRDDRLTRLAESIAALQELWKGQPVTANGRHVRLTGATSAPTPATPPRVVAGVGGSPRTAQATLELVDEFNVYADAKVVSDVRALIATSGRAVEVSLFFDWSWDKWPSDPAAKLDPWRAEGIDRFFISLGADNMPARIEQLATLT